MPVIASALDATDGFDAWFTPEGDDFLYRRGGTGPAYRVSQDECDAFIAAHDNDMLRLFVWAFGAGFVIVVTLLLASGPISRFLGGVSYPTLWFSAAGALAVAILVALHRISTAPDRAVSNRTPVSPAIPRAKRRRLRLEQRSWGSIILWLSICAINVLRVVDEHTRDTGSWIILALYAMLGVWLVWDAVQKWRLTRQPAHTASIRTL